MSRYSDQTYAAVLARELGNASDGVQKGEGSLVFNALSAMAYEVERLYIQMDYIIAQSHAQTADYDHLKLIGADRGLTPLEATYAEVQVLSDVPLPIGTRFNLKSHNYAVAEQLTGDNYTSRAVCEEAGSDPNTLTGACTMIDYVPQLTSCSITGLLVAGRDYETQAAFYERYLKSFSAVGYAGNVTAYKTALKAVNGVGGVKVYPVWNGGGTVKGVIQASDWGVPSSYLIQQIQQAFSPTPSTGYGLCPIGHDFTAAAVTATAVNVATSIQFADGYDADTLQTSIRAKLTEFLLNLAKGWEDADAITIYISRLESALLDIEGITDVTATSLNGTAANLILGADVIPQLGKVTITTI